MDWIYLSRSLVRELNVNRLRKLLSILGVIIGTGAVIACLAVVEGGRHQLYTYLNKLGVNMVYLEDRYQPERDFDPAKLARFGREAPDMAAGGPRPANEDGAGGKKPPRPGRAAPNPDIGEGQRAPPQRLPPGGDEMAALRPRQGTTLSVAHAEFLRKRYPAALNIEPQMLQWTDIGRVGAKTFQCTVEGSTPEGAFIRNLQVAAGRYLCPNDMTQSARVCVLGAEMARRLFGNDPPLGESISLFGTRWTVVGLLQPKGSLMRFDYDKLVIVPLPALQERAGISMINRLLIRAKNTEAALQIYRSLLGEVLALLPDRKPDDFQVFSQDELIRQKEETLRTFKLLTVSIAAFSLLVSGIGIMNIMLVTVRERTREIGVWKAVGATDSDVLIYYLAESVLTCLLGGVLGIFLGIFLGFQATGLIANRVVEISGWVAIFKIQFILLAFGTSALVGLFSGLFPAYVAARLEPSEALRHE
jgi:putative ABC transport system permease protein